MGAKLSGARAHNTYLYNYAAATVIVLSIFVEVAIPSDSSKNNQRRHRQILSLIKLPTTVRFSSSSNHYLLAYFAISNYLIRHTGLPPVCFLLHITQISFTLLFVTFLLHNRHISHLFIIKSFPWYQYIKLLVTIFQATNLEDTAARAYFFTAFFHPSCRYIVVAAIARVTV